MDYRQTLNLPKTDFPMKAELPKREPQRVQWWDEQRTYERRLERNASNPPWILHDGPPYANGELHMGHFLNMVLKDMFVKIALLDDKFAKFVPGWDMHGLPIEYETLKFLGITDFHAVDPLELREKCRERALYWLDRQRDQRRRMGTFGTFEHPYRTIDPSFEATIVNAIADLAEMQQIYKGLRSTLWCVHDETALAEAEIEYEQRRSPSIYVKFPPPRRNSASAFLRRFRCRKHRPTFLSLSGRRRRGRSPRTSRSRCAKRRRTVCIASATKRSSLPKRSQNARSANVSPKPHCSRADRRAARRSFGATSIYGSRRAGCHRALRRSRNGNRHRSYRAGTRRRRFRYRHAVRFADFNPVDAAGRFTSEAGPYAGMHIFKANPKIVSDLRESGALWSEIEIEHSYPHCWRCRNPVIFRATAHGLSRWIKTFCVNARSMRSKLSSMRRNGAARAKSK